MLVDYERVLLDLKRALATKPSHGADALMAEIARLEVQHTLEEGLPERALRLYGLVFSESTRPAHLHASSERVGDGSDDQPEVASGDHRPEEDTRGSIRIEPAREGNVFAAVG